MAKILYAEEANQAEYLKIRLGSDHEIVHVTTIEKAEAEVHQTQFDLIIIEPILPFDNHGSLYKEEKQDEFSGIVFLYQLLRMTPSPSPVIVTTAWVSVDFLALGADRVFVKPFNVDLLVKAVEELLAASEDNPLIEEGA